MREENRKTIEERKKLPQFTTMNVIDGQAGLINYSSLIFYSLTIDNILNIIVLLILASVSIAMLTGKNGILTQATNAKEKTDKATEEEKIQMAVMGCSITNNGWVDVLDTNSFTNELTNQFGKDNYQLVANGDGSFIITVEDTQRKYYVNDDKTVINSDNIIEINDIQGLSDFRDDVNNGNSYEGKAVLLTDDITLSENWTPIGIISPDTDNKNPETGDNKPFKGIFDGGNHTINNLNVSSTENKYNGLFSFVVDGTIKNITIGSMEEKNEVTGSSGAGVVGFLYGFEGNISNCINYSNLDCNSGGGIVGLIAGQHTIYGCKNYGTINGSGGIVGSSNGTDWEQFVNVSNTIINCGNYGNIIKESGDYCGGIVGYFKGDILNSCNKGEISATESSIGGIAGAVNGTIQNCYNTKNVSGKNLVGGIAGGTASGYKVINCYSLGDVTGSTAAGSIVPTLETGNAETINCYTKNDTFTTENLGSSFKDGTENVNDGYPLLIWE